MAALQRKNFRCPRVDGHNINSSSSSSGGRSPSRSGGSGGGCLVVSHAELPPRQRKRVQVGATNLTRSLSTSDLPPPSSSSGGEHGRRPPGDDADVTRAAMHVCETNVALRRATMAGPLGQRPGHLGPLPSEQAIRGLVVLTEQRKRESQTTGKGPMDPVEARTPSSRERRRAETPTSSDVAHGRDQFEDDNARVGDEDDRHQHHHHDTDPKRSREFLATRRKLRDAFVNRYGSVRAVFRAFDGDRNGMISFQRFLDMVEASEAGLSPEETREVFTNVDTNGDNTIEFQEFSEMFTACEYHEAASAYSPTRGGSGVTQDPSSSVALKFRAPLDLSPRQRERMKALRVRVNGELLERHGRDVSVHGGKTENLLIYAFKQFDADNDGFLSYEQVKAALGKDYLQLHMDGPEMDEMIRLIDRNADEKISMKEFVQYFGAGDREPPTDLIDNGRKKELAALHLKATAPLTPRALVDPAFGATQRAPPVTIDMAIEEPPNDPGCLPEQLSRRIASSPMFQQPPSEKRSTMSTTSNNNSSSSTHQRRRRHHSNRLSTAASMSMPSLGLGATDPTNDDDDDADPGPSGRRRPKSEQGPVVRPLPVVSQDRFAYWRAQRTDWTRVGVGGDGTDPLSPAHAGPHERFATTSHGAFSPLLRGAHSGDLRREGIPQGVLEAEARASRRAARHERTTALLEGFAAAREQDERLRAWKTRAKTRLGAERRYAYLDRVHEAENRVALREQQMARHHGGVRFHRMWAGSPDSQFNNTHVTAPGDD